MKNPAEFWENSIIGKKAVNNFVPRAPYERAELEDEDGNNVFNQIGRILCSAHSDEFIKGYLDLDKAWLESNDPNIVEARKQLEDYKDPFCGRRAYLVSVPIVKDNDKGTKTLGGIKKTKGDNWYLWGRVCLFNNEELGWSEEDTKTTKKEMVDGVLTEVEVEAPDRFKYISMSCFVPDDVAMRLLKESAELIKEEPDLEEIYYFFLTLKAEPDEYKGKRKARMNVDDFILLE
ncbi:MAG: hypothetical protein ACTSQ8_08160 [Candidatus Helarchaeota archaeon]